MRGEFEAAVIGYGPTGLVLASLLGRLGHRVLVVEKWPTLYGLPRLTHIDGETARLLSFACDIDHALHDSSPIDSCVFYDARGRPLVDAADVPTLPMGYPAHISIHQPDIECALDQRIRDLSNVTVKQGAELVGLRLESNQAELKIRTQERDETARARFVFGADGARSFVRDCLGIERQDFGFNERWLNIDTERKRELPRAFAETKVHCDPARGYMFMPIGKARQRFEFALLSHEDTKTMEQPATAWRILKQYHNIGPDDVSIIRQTVYTFEGRLATSWRRGVALLGGDAAHTMPPYLGQGACSGIRDAANVAWKLHLVLKGRATADLLDSYETERRPHVSNITKTSIMFGKIANTRSRVVAAVRNAAFRTNLMPPPPPFPPFPAGIIESRKGAAKKAVGTVPPQGYVAVKGKRGRLDEHAGYNFALIARSNPFRTLSPSQIGFLQTLRCRVFTLADDAAMGVERLFDSDGIYTKYLDQFKAAAMLTRPDTNLFGFATDATDLPRLIDELMTKLCWREQ